MAVFRLSLVLRWSLIASVLLLIGMVIRELLTTPTLVTVAGTQSLVYILLFVGALLIFSWFAFFGVRRGFSHPCKEKGKVREAFLV